jgi:hypothetical protein
LLIKLLNVALCSIALQRFLPETQDEKKYIVSCLTFTPLIIFAKNTSKDGTLRQRLLQMMAILRGQYAAWLGHPGLPFAHSIDPKSPHLNENRCIPMITNIGVVENYISERWNINDASGVMEAQELKFGHRFINSFRP